MKSEVIALTSFVTDGQTDGRTPSIYMSPNGFAMAGDNNYVFSFDGFKDNLFSQNQLYNFNVLNLR